MAIIEAVAQPYKDSSVRKLVGSVLQAGGIANLDVAAAYVTTGGVRDLLRTVQLALAGQNQSVKKRWLVAFDYCRSEPLALDMLLKAPSSLVRIHDANVLLRQHCIPSRPFHPKTFIFTGPSRKAVFCGSGNISRSGLNTGHEVGLLLDSQSALGDAHARGQISVLGKWYEKMWAEATILSPHIASKYKEIYESTPNLNHPTPTDDDEFGKLDLGNNALTPLDLRKLRACSNFWIEAGNITKNLGAGQPGNQLMMKRLSRVFFGVPATPLPENSWLLKLSISFEHHAPKDDCSLTYSDNGMDKLTLPLPGSGGPTKYDNEVLLFSRQEPGKFRLSVGSTAQKNVWRKRSEAIQASYKMTGAGRRWGVF